MLRLFHVHLLLHVKLISDIFNRSHAFFLFQEETVDQLGHPELQPRSKLPLQPVDHLLEVVGSAQSVNLHTCQALPLTRLVLAHHGNLLVDLKDLGLQLLKHVIDDVLGEISAFLVGHGGVLGGSETALEDLQATLVVGIQTLQVLDLLFVFLPETYHLVE